MVVVFQFYLKKYILESFPAESAYPEVVDFVVEQVRRTPNTPNPYPADLT